MRKLRPGKVKDLVEITQLVRGKRGLEPRSPDSYLLYRTAAPKSPKEKRRKLVSVMGSPDTDYVIMKKDFVYQL